MPQANFSPHPGRARKGPIAGSSPVPFSPERTESCLELEPLTPGVREWGGVGGCGLVELLELVSPPRRRLGLTSLPLCTLHVYTDGFSTAW